MIRRLKVVTWLGGWLMFTANLAAPTPEASGTYDLLVCKGPCSFGSSTNVVVKGALVLAAAPFTHKLLNQRSVVPFKRAYDTGGDPNGCFVLDTVEERRSFAGLLDFGLTQWVTESGRVQFQLLAAPDAGYIATLTMTSDGLRGEGRSSGGGTPDRIPGPDILVAKRVGPGNVDACVRAAAERRGKPRRAA